MHAHTCTGWLSRTPTLDTCGIKASVRVLAISSKKADHARPRNIAVSFVTDCGETKNPAVTNYNFSFHFLAFFILIDAYLFSPLPSYFALSDPPK